METELQPQRDMDAEFNGARVLIQNEKGKYLTRRSLNDPVSFTDNKSLAYVYDYTADGVAARLEAEKLLHGKTWTACKL